jgi:hypothetical protein
MYEIKSNDDGKLYLDISKENEEIPEHKFMAIEITRYLLTGLLKDNQKMQELEQQTEIEIVKAGNILEQISAQVGIMLKEQNDVMNDVMDDLGLDVQDNE